MSYALLMTDYLSVDEAVNLSGYTPAHIRWLLREGKVKGVHKSRVWWIDKDSFEEYWAAMSELGDQRYNPYKNKEK